MKNWFKEFIKTNLIFLLIAGTIVFLVALGMWFLFVYSESGGY